MDKMSWRKVESSPRQASFGSSDLQSTSPVMQAIEGIDAMIASGRLIPGQRLAEGDLSDELGIPRGRVREALRILAGSGVVELAPYKSARVRRLSKTEVASLFETITGLFCTGAVLLAMRYPNLPAKDKATFAKESEQLAIAARKADLLDLMALMVKYHGLINQLSGNDHLTTLMSSLHLAHYYRSAKEIIPEILLRRALGKCTQISQAVIAGKPDRTLSNLWDAISPMIVTLNTDREEPKVRHPREKVGAVEKTSAKRIPKRACDSS